MDEGAKMYIEVYNERHCRWVRSDGAYKRKDGEWYLAKPQGKNRRPTLDTAVGKTIGLHVVICETFHGDRPENHVVNHKDGNKINNAEDNLEWVTQKANKHHALLTGLADPKRKCKPVQQLTLNGDLIREWESKLEAEEILGVHQANIGAVCRGRQKSAGGFRWVYK